MNAAVGLVSWRLPGRLQDSPSLAARVGARRLQIDYGGNRRAYELTPSTTRQLRSQADSEGIAITAVAVNALNDLGVTSADRQDQMAIGALTRKAIDAAVALDAPAVLIPAFRRSAIRTSHDATATAAFLVRIAQLAATAELVVVHENVLEPAKLITLREAVHAAGVRVLFDIGNLHEHRIDWQAYLAEATPVLHSEAHIKDHRSGPAGDIALGCGRVPLGPAVEALLRTRIVDGFVVETDHRDHGEAQIRADLAALTNLIDDNGSAE
ncbi:MULTISPECIES: sugar phosphate isomerase/epimerase [unclassified Microbacterium]|uniref:sugar phosphate isomerase/epimerase family protein n=1 Tax=unclassified Microbacterium TaxID=2609290 RepID=UPI0015E334F5|nr:MULTISPECIES: TIM barrel protein [unclassified Microbacterium]